MNTLICFRSALVPAWIAGLIWAGFLSAFAPALRAEPVYPAIPFEYSDFAQFQQRAAQQGKPFFIAFMKTASEPCRVMEALTFTDPVLSAYVGAHFLAYRADMDASTRSNDDLADRFQVRFYPTIIVFDESGRQRHRFSGLKDALSFQEELERVSTQPAPRAVIRDLGRQEVFAPAIRQEAPSDFEKADLIALYRPSSYARAPQTEKTEWTAPAPDPVRVLPAPDPQPSVAGPMKGFALQAGAFSQIQNARNLQQILQQEHGFPALIWTAYSNAGTAVYKVMVGPFSHREGAQQWKSGQSAAASWFVVALNP